jgi:ppGpp synthetase/RelA/SpoT-type nucleotidyltranferase
METWMAMLEALKYKLQEDLKEQWCKRLKHFAGFQFQIGRRLNLRMMKTSHVRVPFIVEKDENQFNHDYKESGD